jgi:hypothetical protein
MFANRLSSAIMDMKKIDWLNHTIAFASSVIGIFIAFQLDDWQERTSRREEMEVTLKAIKAEIETNLYLYHENDSILGLFVEYFDFCDANSHDGGLLLSKKDLADALNRFPGRFDDAKLIRKINDSLALYDVIRKVDVIPASGISTANWEAATASGILAQLDHNRAVLLTQVYEWTTKNLGYSDDQLYGTLISQSYNFKDLTKSYQLIARVSEIRYQQMRQYYEKIEW